MKTTINMLRILFYALTGRPYVIFGAYAGLGDYLLYTPLFRAIKEASPETKIFFTSHCGSHDLLFQEHDNVYSDRVAPWFIKVFSM